jgi:hypothetical protein
MMWYDIYLPVCYSLKNPVRKCHECDIQQPIKTLHRNLVLAAFVKLPASPKCSGFKHSNRPSLHPHLHCMVCVDFEVFI